MSAQPAQQAEPYVSLLDDLRTLNGVLTTGGGDHPLSPNEIPGILSALVRYVEHGDALLRAATYGWPAVEAILTPDRPNGWVDPNATSTDPRDAELAELRAKVAQIDARPGVETPADPKDQELAELRAQARDREIAELRQQAAAQAGQGMNVTVTSDTPPAIVEPTSLGSPGIGDQVTGPGVPDPKPGKGDAK